VQAVRVQPNAMGQVTMLATEQVPTLPTLEVVAACCASRRAVQANANDHWLFAD
jgi:hypothetical protein